MISPLYEAGWAGGIPGSPAAEDHAAEGDDVDQDVADEVHDATDEDHDVVRGARPGLRGARDSFKPFIKL